MINKNGSLFTWRYFVDINNEELYIDRNNYPTQILTKNQIGSLIYTKQLITKPSNFKAKKKN